MLGYCAVGTCNTGELTFDAEWGKTETKKPSNWVGENPIEYIFYN